MNGTETETTPHEVIASPTPTQETSTMKWPQSKSGPRRVLLAGIVSAGLILAACGSTGAADQPGEVDSTTQASAGSGDPILDFYQCLRDSGLDVADPGPGGTIGLHGFDLDDPPTQALVRACAETHLATSDGRVTVGGGGGNMGDNLADAEALLAFVDCMNDNGVNMADPSADGRLALPEDIDPQSAEFQAAVHTCAIHLGGGGILIGTGGGGTATRGDR
jgi:hypothetical protein